MQVLLPEHFGKMYRKISYARSAELEKKSSKQNKTRSPKQGQNNWHGAAHLMSAKQIKDLICLRAAIAVPTKKNVKFCVLLGSRHLLMRIQITQKGMNKNGFVGFMEDFLMECMQYL